MGDKNRKITPLPDAFETEEQAGVFWDTHSAMNYEESFEPGDDVIKISERIFEVQVAEDVFEKLRHQATALHQSIPKLVDGILRKELS